jgi:hypothetical protein
VAAVTWESAKVLRLGLITLSFQEKRPQSTSILLTEFPPAASSGPPCPPRKCCIWKGHWVFRLWQILLYLAATTATPGTFFSPGSLWRLCRMKQGGQTLPSWADASSAYPGFLGLRLKGMSGMQGGLAHLFCPIFHLFLNFNFW